MRSYLKLFVHPGSYLQRGLEDNSKDFVQDKGYGIIFLLLSIILRYFSLPSVVRVTTVALLVRLTAETITKALRT